MHPCGELVNFVNNIPTLAWVLVSNGILMPVPAVPARPPYRHRW